MIISIDTIENLCQKTTPPIIEHFDSKSSKRNPAKVQLRLGKKCFCKDLDNKPIELKDGDSISIPPNAVFMFETYERINMPSNYSGRVSLRMSLVEQGLFMPSTTQVDPGYSNVLFNMVYNLGSEPVVIDYKQALISLEIMETEESSCAYNGNMRFKSFSDYTENRISSSLSDLHNNILNSYKSIEKIKKRQEKVIQEFDHRVNLFSTIIAILSVLLTILTIVVAIVGFMTDPDIKVMTYKVEELNNRIENQENSLKNYEKEIKELQEQLARSTAFPSE